MKRRINGVLLEEEQIIDHILHEIHEIRWDIRKIKDGLI